MEKRTLQNFILEKYRILSRLSTLKVKYNKSGFLHQVQQTERVSHTYVSSSLEKLKMEIEIKKFIIFFKSNFWLIGWKIINWKLHHGHLSGCSPPK